MTAASGSGLKSAYERAMERLGPTGPATALTAAQKAALAEETQAAQAEVASLDIMMQKDMEAARQAGDGQKLQDIQAERVRRIAKIQQDLEDRKKRIRQTS